MTTTTFRVKDNTGWKSTIGFKKLKEAVNYAKELITDKDWQDATHFYIEVIQIKRSPIKTEWDMIKTKDIIFYDRYRNEWLLSKNYKVVKF